MIPIMTMHQVKGLQFPFVFVGHMGEQPEVSTAHRLETQFAQFPTNPSRSFALLPETTRAELDMIRQYYVAYSRAQWALVLMGTTQQFNRGRVPCGPTSAWLPTRVFPL
jgi:DNA helicase-2/ATP-dependent DNA helicase PcrA